MQNKGIGKAIVQSLLQNGPHPSLVYLTARDEARGREAVQDVSKYATESKVQYHQLDIGDPTSIDAFASYIKQEHGSVDVLVRALSLSLYLSCH